MIGADGFKWEEVEIESSKRQGRQEDIYFYVKDNLPQGVYIKREYVDLANMKSKDALKLYAQGVAIFMLKKDKDGTFMIGKNGSRYVRVGNSSLARKLYSIAHEYEVLEATNDYILFRPIRG